MDGSCPTIMNRPRRIYLAPHGWNRNQQGEQGGDKISCENMKFSVIKRIASLSEAYGNHGITGNTGYERHLSRKERYETKEKEKLVERRLVDRRMWTRLQDSICGQHHRFRLLHINHISEAIPVIAPINAMAVVIHQRLSSFLRIASSLALSAKYVLSGGSGTISRILSVSG